MSLVLFFIHTYEGKQAHELMEDAMVPNAEQRKKKESSENAHTSLYQHIVYHFSFFASLKSIFSRPLFTGD